MPTLFVNAALLDVEAGVLRPGTSVLVDGERIVEVSDRPIATSSAERIDCRGRTLIALLDDRVSTCSS